MVLRRCSRARTQQRLRQEDALGIPTVLAKCKRAAWILRLPTVFCVYLVPLRSSRPVACPNAGFMARLLSYERQLYGSNSYVPPQQLKKAKPEPVTCPVCGQAVGISSASLAVHMKRAHPPPEGAVGLAAAAAGSGAGATSGGGGSVGSHGGGGSGHGGVARASGTSRKALLQAHGGGGAVWAVREEGASAGRGGEGEAVGAAGVAADGRERVH